MENATLKEDQSYQPVFPHLRWNLQSSAHSTAPTCLHVRRLRRSSLLSLFWSRSNLRPAKVLLSSQVIPQSCTIKCVSPLFLSSSHTCASEHRQPASTPMEPRLEMSSSHATTAGTACAASSTPTHLRTPMCVPATVSASLLTTAISFAIPAPTRRGRIPVASTSVPLD